MNYSIENLNVVADCNALLSWAAREKADLNHKKYSDERLTTRFEETSLQLNAELQGVLAELAATEIMIANLPEGPSRQESQDKKIRLEYRKFVLENRKESYGTVALLQKEMDLARVIQELEEVDAFQQAIEARKRTLEA